MVGTCGAKKVSDESQSSESPWRRPRGCLSAVTDLRYPATRPICENPHSCENDPDPPVPNVRCNHGCILAIRGVADIAVAVKSSFRHDSRRMKPLATHHCGPCVELLPSVQMKFEGLLAINAAIEMAMNVLFGVGGQLAVDIRLKFVQRLFAISH